MHAGRTNWPKIVGRLPPSIITKNIVSSKQPRLSTGTTPTMNLPSFTRETVRF
jgi:hypothetical protein